MTVAVAFPNHQPTGRVSSHLHITPLMTGASSPPIQDSHTDIQGSAQHRATVPGCETINHQNDRTSATDN